MTDKPTETGTPDARQRIVDQLKNILIDDLFVEILPEQISMDDGLQSVIGLDSVSFIELRVLCERRFGIEIHDSEFAPENFRTIALLTTLILRKKASGG